MTESDNPPSEARPLETEPLVIERLESVFEPPLPNRPGDRRRWARLFGSGKGLPIAAAVRRHRGPCLVIVLNAADAAGAGEMKMKGGEMGMMDMKMMDTNKDGMILRTNT